MSMIEDTRKLLQDVVTPDFKALGVRVDALTHRVDALEKTMKEGFAEASTKEGLLAAERFFKESFATADRVTAANEKLAAARHEVLSLKLEQAVSNWQASYDALMSALNLDRRIERMERSGSAQQMPNQERLELPKSA